MVQDLSSRDFEAIGERSHFWLSYGSAGLIALTLGLGTVFLVAIAPFMARPYKILND